MGEALYWDTTISSFGHAGSYLRRQKTTEGGDTEAGSSSETVYLALPEIDFMAALTQINRQSANIALVRSFVALPHGWNGYDAQPIPADVADRAIRVLAQLRWQPQVFPTGRRSVQFEYDSGDTSLEIEVRPEHVAFLRTDGDDSREWIGDDSSIPRNVREFHVAVHDSGR